MKIVYKCGLLLVFQLLSIEGNSQNRANTWMLGYRFCDACPKVGIKFNSGVADTFSVFRSMGMTNTIISLSDTDNNLAFYSNGVWIANSNHDTLKNSKDFNPGYLTGVFGFSNYGMRWFEEILALPVMGRPDSFYVFSESGEEVSTPFVSYDLQPLSLKYSIIDMKGDNGLGEMVLKAHDAINDTLTAGRLTACKHANGRDWWVVSHEYYSDKFYVTLVTPDSVYAPLEQHIGVKVDEFDIIGQACFSPDGSKYAMINTNDTCMLFDFDRCSGLFSNERIISLWDSSYYLACQFSPSGRFLYATSYTRIYQFDTYSNNIDSSGILVAQLLPYGGIPKYFSMMQSATDGRIYISPYNGWNFLHYIANPDSQGIACDVIQEGFTLPSYHSGGLPNQINYDLGPLVGSLCDTLTAVQEANENAPKQILIYPNPASSLVNIVYYLGEAAIFELTDITGLKRKMFTLYPYYKNRLLWIDDLEKGIYFYSIRTEDKLLNSGKIVVSR